MLKQPPPLAFQSLMSYILYNTHIHSYGRILLIVYCCRNESYSTASPQTPHPYHRRRKLSALWDSYSFCITHFVTTYRVEGRMGGGGNRGGRGRGGCLLWVRMEGNNWNETKGARAVNNEPTHHVASGLLNEHHEYFKAVQYSQGIVEIVTPLSPPHAPTRSG